jgi:hypothetical protein
VYGTAYPRETATYFNMDETGFPLNNILPQIVAAKGARKVVKFTNVERGENVTAVVCCSVSGVFIPPFVIFKELDSETYTSRICPQDLKSQ